MRTPEQIDAIKGRLATKDNQDQILGMFPGYMAGFELSLESDGRVAITAGLTTIRGTMVSVRDTVRLTDSMWQVPKINSMYYYIFVDVAGEYHVDSIAAVFENDYLGYYHPVYGWRYCGKLYVNASREYEYVLTEGSLRANKLTIDDLNATIATVNGYIQVLSNGFMGQSYSGTPANGDTRCYIDGNELKIDYYDGPTAAWTTIGKLGGDENKNYFPYLQVRGLIKTGAITETLGLDIGEIIPTGTFKAFDFEADVKDKDAVDPWDSEVNLTYATSSNALYGAYSLKGSDSNAYLRDVNANGMLWTNDISIDGHYFIPAGIATTYADLVQLTTGKKNTCYLSNASYTAESSNITGLQYVESAHLSETAFIIAWGDTTNNKSYACIGILSNDIISFGSEILYDSNLPADVTVIALSATKVVVGWRDGTTGYSYYRAGNVSGSTLSLGTAVSMGSGTAYYAMCPMDATHFVLSYRGPSGDLLSSVGTIDGLIITFGSTYMADSNIPLWMASCKVTSERFALVWGISSNIDSKIGVLSNDIITYGALADIDIINGEMNVALLASDKLCVNYGNGTRTRIGEMSNDVITWGSSVTPTATGPFAFIEKLTEDSFLIFGDTAGVGKVQLGDVSGTTITLQTSETLIASLTGAGRPVRVKDDIVVVPYEVTGIHARVVGRKQTFFSLQAGGNSQIKRIFQNGTGHWLSNITSVLSNTWHHFSLNVDADAGVWLTLDSNVITTPIAAGFCTDSNTLYLRLPQTDFRLDDLMLGTDTFLSNAASIAHYGHGQPWAEDVDYDKDLVLIPKTGGKVILNKPPYDTGWINRSEWRNVHLGSSTTKDADSNVAHNLNAPLSDLLVKVLISTDGTDNNAQIAQNYQHWQTNTPQDIETGISIWQVDSNNIKIQTGAHGLMWPNDAGEDIILDDENWYYKIKVYLMG